jgi:hypothetical protein
MAMQQKKDSNVRLAEGPTYVYQVKVTLKGIRPPIWRRVLLPPEISLEKLHLVLQAVMGWTNCHLHKFTADGISYGDTSIDTESPMNNEKRYRLNHIVRGEKEKFFYVYDLGDYWEHEILVEKMVVHAERLAYPVCITGKRACPPEDCGGPWGYEELLEILKDPSHPEHEERLDWLPRGFDSEKGVTSKKGSRLLLAHTKHGDRVVTCYNSSGWTLPRRGQGSLSHVAMDYE